MFKNVIVRKHCKSMIDGITSAPELGKPDYDLALKQHAAYIEALKKCGVGVSILEAGYEVIEADTSEYRKLDGGLSCLSLRL